MSQVENRLQEMGLSVPEVAAPVAAYVPALRNGDLVYTSGQLPLVAGQLRASGKLGAEITTEMGYELAQTCVLNAIAAVRAQIGDLDKVVRVVKVLGFVASTSDFYDQPQVINGASELLGKAFGDAGEHARSAVGVAVLPRNAPVEVELIVAVRD